jgi:MFS family permease
MSWPFLTLFLHDKYNLSVFNIGVMITISELISVFISSYIGFLSDIYGRKKIMIIGCLVSSSGFLIIGLASLPFYFYMGLQAVSIARPTFENAVKAFISDKIDNKGDKEFVFNLRYLLLNLGGVFGPMFGVLFSSVASQDFFIITSGVYLAYLAFVFFSLKDFSYIKSSGVRYAFWGEAYRSLTKDKKFLIFSFFVFSINIAFAIVFISLPQYIVTSELNNPRDVVAALISINTISVVMLQYPLSVLVKKISLKLRVIFALIFVLLGQSIIVFSSPNSHYPFYFSTFFTTISEIIMVPSVLLIIDDISPAHLKGFYYATSNSLISFCFALMPTVGGAIIIFLNYKALFFIGFFLSILVILCFFLNRKNLFEDERTYIDCK